MKIICWRTAVVFNYCESTIGNTQTWYGPGTYCIVLLGKQQFKISRLLSRSQYTSYLTSRFAQLIWNSNSTMNLDVGTLSYSDWILHLLYICWYYSIEYIIYALNYHKDNFFEINPVILHWKWLITSCLRFDICIMW